jgi:hypothetical protein
MVEMVILSLDRRVQSEINGTDSGCLSLGTSWGGVLYISPEVYWVPDPSFSSLYVIPSFPSMHFSYLSTTSALLPILFLHLYSVVWHIYLVLPVVRGEFSAHSCNSCRLSCLDVKRGLGENSRNLLCNMGATQPIEIFLPPPWRKSTQLHGFDILTPSFNTSPMCAFSIFNSFRHGLFKEFPPRFLSSPPLVTPIKMWVGGLLAPDVRCSTYPLAAYTSPYPRPIPMIISRSFSTKLNISIFLLYISGLLLPAPEIPQNRLIPPLMQCSAYWFL